MTNLNTLHFNPKITPLMNSCMNTLKFLFQLSLLLVIPQLLQAQIPDDLEMISPYELNSYGQDISLDEKIGMTYKNNPLAMYSRAGEVISAQKFSEALMNRTAAVDFFRKKGEKDIVAAQLREFNSMELEMIKQEEEMMKNSPVAEGKTIPDFEFTDRSGNTISKSNTSGNILVINTWFVKCKPCIMEIPELNDLVEKYKGHSNIQFLAVTFDSDDEINSFLEREKFDFNIITNQMGFLQKIKIMSYPTNIIVDPEGQIVFNAMGYNPANIKKMDELLENMTK